jgi:hypothetical protein
MTTPTYAEQTAGFINETFKDGEAGDGAPTAEENAAAAANTAAATESGEETGAESAGEGEEGSENKGEAGEESGAETGKTDDAAAAAAAAGKAKGKDPAKRIGEVTANWRSAQRDAESHKSRADDLQRQLDALKSGKAPLTGVETPGNSGAVPPDPSPSNTASWTRSTSRRWLDTRRRRRCKAEKAEDETARQAAAADVKRQETAEKQDKLHPSWPGPARRLRRSGHAGRPRGQVGPFPAPRSAASGLRVRPAGHLRPREEPDRSGPRGEALGRRIRPSGSAAKKRNSRPRSPRRASHRPKLRKHPRRREPRAAIPANSVSEPTPTTSPP